MTTQLDTINTTLGSPFQAGGSIGNTSFGISGTLPAFASTPTFNLGTLNGAATAANQTNASQKTQIVDGSGNVIASTSNNLNVQCANCSGSGASGTDQGTFTAGASTFAPGGGFYQTSATSNPLTTGQWGAWQMTANRAGFVNLRNTAGAEIATSSIPLRIDPTGTTTQPVAVTSAIGLAQGSTTSGQTGSMIMGAVTTSAPTYTTAQTSPISLDTAGNIRVSDSSVIAAKGEGATGSAVPSGAQLQGVQSGANMVAQLQASASVAINVNTATTTQLVALSGSTKIYVTSYDVIAGGTGNITFVYGTGTNCGTGTTSLTGPYNLTAQAGIAKGSGMGPVLIVPAGNALCVTTSAAQQMSGSVSYTQF